MNAITERPTFATDAETVRAFDTNFNRQPFLFNHSLQEYEKLGLPALREFGAELFRNTVPHGVVALPGASKLKWGTPEFQETANKAFEEIESCKLRLKLSSVQLEPGYARFSEELQRELMDLTSGKLGKGFGDIISTIFITSPQLDTFYHVDAEANYLLQIHGTKTVYIFDGNDPDLVNESILDRYWNGQPLSLSKELECRGTPYVLTPGTGVHIPVHFPHWVQNGPEPSVSLSLGFLVSPSPIDVVQFNRYLRKLGLNPAGPGKNRMVDSMKCAVINAARATKRTIRRPNEPAIRLR